MKYERKIVEIGGSYGIVIPLDVLKFLELEKDDEIILQVEERKHGKFVSFWKKGK